MRDYFQEGLEVSYWKPGYGPHVIVIVPYVVGAYDPVIPNGQASLSLAVYVHYRDGKAIVCLSTFGQRCPICDYLESLEVSCKHILKPDLVRSMKRKKRILYNVLVLNSNLEEQTGVQIFETSEYLFHRRLLHTAMAVVEPPRLDTRTPTLEEVTEYILALDRYNNTVKKELTFADMGNLDTMVAFSKVGSGPMTQYTCFKFEKMKRPISDSILEQSHCLDELIHIPSFEEAYDFALSEK